MVIKAFLRVQIGPTSITIPINIRKSITHSLLLPQTHCLLFLVVELHFKDFFPCIAGFKALISLLLLLNKVYRSFIRSVPTITV